MILHASIALLTLLPAIQDVAPEESARYSELLFPGIVPVDGQGGPSVAVTCVLDAYTGLPIPGAKLTAVFEAGHPLAGEWWSTRSVFADAEGWVRLRLDDLAPRGDVAPGAQPWLYVEAKGYATQASLGRHLEPSVRLEPGRSHEVLVLDALDRPLVGAQIGWYLGCGHTPDVRVVRTDTRGRARFEDVDPEDGELWVVARGAQSDPLDPWGGTFTRLRVEPAPVWRGRVLDASGAPLEGLFVGQSVYHRGPWTRSGAGGRFELFGLPVGASVWVGDVGQSYPGMASFDLPEPGREVVFVVPIDASAHQGTVEVALRGPAGEPLSGTALMLMRADDGFTVTGTSDGAGLAALQVPPGRYTVRAGGELSGFEPRRAEVRVEASATGAAARVELVLLPEPRIHLDRTGLPDDARVVVVAEHGELEFDPSSPVTVPREGFVGVRVEVGERSRAIELPLAARVDGATVALEAPAPGIVRLWLAGPEGEPAQGWALLRDPHGSERLDVGATRVSDPAREHELRTWHLGPADLWAIPADPAFAARRVRLELPLGEGPLDLGEVRLADPGATWLGLIEADGAPLAPSRVELRRPGLRELLELDAAGRLAPGTFEPREGDLLRVETEGWPPFRAELVGSGPWTVTRPAGALSVEALDETGAPLPVFGLWIDGEFFAASGPGATLEGLAPGLHRAVLVAPGRQSLLWNFTLGPDERRAVRMPLPPAP